MTTKPEAVPLEDQRYCSVCGARDAKDCPEQTFALKRCLYVVDLEARLSMPLEREFPMEVQVEGLARLISESPLIDAPKLPPAAWMGFARHCLEYIRLPASTNATPNGDSDALTPALRNLESAAMNLYANRHHLEELDWGWMREALEKIGAVESSQPEREDGHG